MGRQATTVRRRNGVCVLTLNRPEKLNALNDDMLDRLLHTMDSLAADSAVRCLILTGAGRAFCAGADLDAPISPDLLRHKSASSPSGAWIESIARFPRPTIAAINGVAAGGGLAIALACDIRYAAATARFTTSFVRTGRPALDGVSYFLPRVVGVEHAFRLLYGADIVDSSEALRLGLVSAVSPDESLLSDALALAEKLANGPPVALGIIKGELFESLRNSLREQLVLEDHGAADNRRRATFDVAEGRIAFHEKRPPLFRG